MTIGGILSDKLLLPDHSEQHSHPMDSTRLLLGLLSLSRTTASVEKSATLDGIISKEVLRSLICALHFRDVSTVRHSRQTALLATALAQHLGWEGRQLRVLEVAALMHDLGKIGVPDNILYKPGGLNADEARLMGLHNSIGLNVLQACRADPEVLEIIAQSSRNYGDSSEGYRRIGSNEHQGARILAVADAYDSMRREQVFRPGKSHDEIITILSEGAGTLFDGNIVLALARWIDNGGLPKEKDHFDVTAISRGRGTGQLSDDLEASSICNIFSYLYLLESMYDGFYLVDRDLQIVVWNRGCEDVLGWTSQKMSNQVCARECLAIANEAGQELADNCRPMFEAIRSQKPSTAQVGLQHTDGSWVPVELQSVPLIDQSGELQGVVEIFRCLSENSTRSPVYRELELAATRDSLTAVANRRELEIQLWRELEKHSQEQNQEPLSIVFLDIDHFKSINDTYGHVVGDKVLHAIAGVLQGEAHAGELVARYGGEEFVILCPANSGAQAFKLAELARLAICNTRIAELPNVQITASFGVTEAEKGDTVESLLDRADKALYMSKEGGRNRTSTLTEHDLMEQSTNGKTQRVEPTDPFHFSGSFLACTAADLVVHKLSGFVNDNKAMLAEVTPKRAVIRMGRRGLLPVWGKNEDKQPVEIEIEFTDECRRDGNHSQRGASQQVKVNINIRPLAWVRDSDLFLSRARKVMKLMKSYFAAD